MTSSDGSPPDTSLPDADTLAFAARVFDLARHGAAADLDALLAQGLPPNLRNDKSDSLLMLAAYNGNEPAVCVLLEHGADPDLLNDNGQSPLAGVAFKGETAIARLLLEHGAKADGTGGDRTPLMVAAMFDKIEIATLLLKHGADPMARDKAGLGALDLARSMGAKAVPALLKSGAGSR